MSQNFLSDMPFLDHLEELRIRLIKSLATVILFTIAAFVFSDKLISFLASPLPKVYYMAPTEAFMAQVKVSLAVGVAAAAPVILYQLWMFVLPGLYETESRVVFPIVISSIVFFYGGAAFCLFYVVPLALHFLMQFGSENVEPLISISEYFAFVVRLALAFAIVFELPIVAYFLGRIGILTYTMLSRGRRYAVVSILVLSAVITPPDIFSQVALTVPVYLLYELSILIVYLTGRRGGRKSKQEDPYRKNDDDLAG